MREVGINVGRGEGRKMNKNVIENANGFLLQIYVKVILPSSQNGGMIELLIE